MQILNRYSTGTVHEQYRYSTDTVQGQYRYSTGNAQRMCCIQQVAIGGHWALSWCWASVKDDRRATGERQASDSRAEYENSPERCVARRHAGRVALLGWQLLARQRCRGRPLRHRGARVVHCRPRRAGRDAHFWLQGSFTNYILPPD